MISSFFCDKGETVKTAKYASSGLAFTTPPPFLCSFHWHPSRWVGWGEMLWSNTGCRSICPASTIPSAQSRAELPLCNTLFLVSLVPHIVWHKVPASHLVAWIDFTAHTGVFAVRIRLLIIISAFQFIVCFNCRPSNAAYICQLTYVLSSCTLLLSQATSPVSWLYSCRCLGTRFSNSIPESNRFSLIQIASVFCTRCHKCLPQCSWERPNYNVEVWVKYRFGFFLILYTCFQVL